LLADRVRSAVLRRQQRKYRRGDKSGILERQLKAESIVLAILSPPTEKAAVYFQMSRVLDRESSGRSSNPRGSGLIAKYEILPFREVRPLMSQRWNVIALR
jgi:hypothetical protein